MYNQQLAEKHGVDYDARVKECCAEFTACLKQDYVESHMQVTATFLCQYMHLTNCCCYSSVTRGIVHVSGAMPEYYNSTSCSDISTTTNSNSDFKAPAFSPITSTILSKDECDKSEGSFLTKQPATRMPSGPAAASVGDLDSVAEPQSQGYATLQ